MAVLSNLQPEKVFYYFEKLCSVPHGSGNTKQISDLCVGFAKELGLKYRQEACNNVIIWKNGSCGYENAAPIILQGHIDMVCAKTEDCTKDMTRDGLDVRTDGEWVWADKTSLGGDNGIAVAMILAILSDETLPHPPIEAVFTVDEEVGMDGAAFLDPAPLQGRRLLNIDSEDEGILTVSCAGGVRANMELPVQAAPCALACWRVTLDGLKGGHSGVEIDKGRANASILMGRLLRRLSRELPMRLVQLHGGQADNAIAPKTTALVLLPDQAWDRAEELTRACGQTFAHEYQTADPGIQVRFDREATPAELPLTAESTGKVIGALALLPNGIQSMSMDIPGLVQTSLNLGILRLEEKEAVATYAVRSSLASEKEMVCDKIECLAQLLDGHVTYVGDYPAWEYKKDSQLRELVADIYEKQTGKKPVIEAIHAGLECGVFAGKLLGLDCISFGPNLEEIHTPRERMDVASVERTWSLVCEVLRRAKELTA